MKPEQSRHQKYYRLCHVDLRVSCVLRKQKTKQKTTNNGLQRCQQEETSTGNTDVNSDTEHYLEQYFENTNETVKMSHV